MSESGLREQLTHIYEQRQQLTPAIVVEEASDPNHPLHDRFEWDDSVAGPAYRLVQARELIRTVRVKFVPADPEAEPSSVRAFLNVETPVGRRYEPVEVVADDPFLRQLTLKQAEREWKQLRARYAHLAEFFDLIRSDVAV